MGASLRQRPKPNCCPPGIRWQHPNGTRPDKEDPATAPRKKFAYLGGSKFGKHKLAPRISPKKSWEGFIGGLVGSMAIWCLITLIPGVNMAIPQALVFGLICGLSGVLGDLAESRIKRNSGVKDSGTIMPGHGGLLDRCDSLFMASVTAAVMLIGGGCVPYVFG